LSLRELKKAPIKVSNLITNLLSENSREFITSDERSYKLARAYVESGAISNKCFTDAEHIALASVHVVDVIASWNFKHMVNLSRIEKYNTINLRFGYPTIDIREPRTLLL